MGYCERCERECDGLTCPVCGGALLQEVDPEAMSPEAVSYTHLTLPTKA